MKRTLSLIILSVLAGCVPIVPTAQKFPNTDPQYVMASAGHWKALAKIAAGDLATDCRGHTGPYAFPLPSPGSKFSSTFRDLLTAELVAQNFGVREVDAQRTSRGALIDVEVAVVKRAQPSGSSTIFTELGTAAGGIAYLAREGVSVNPLQSLAVGVGGGLFVDVTRNYLPSPTDTEIVVTAAVIESNETKCAKSYVVYVPSRDAGMFKDTSWPSPQNTEQSAPPSCGKSTCQTTHYDFSQLGKTSAIVSMTVTNTGGTKPFFSALDFPIKSGDNADLQLILAINSNPDLHAAYITAAAGASSFVDITAPNYMTVALNYKPLTQTISWTVEFSLGSTTLDATAKQVIAGAAKAVAGSSDPFTLLTVTGYTDGTGSARQNSGAIADQRARAVVDQLWTDGITAPLQLRADSSPIASTNGGITVIQQTPNSKPQPIRAITM
jgi:outer membrane protein OmpA-like peptidoglycan-associated protein